MNTDKSTEQMKQNQKSRSRLPVIRIIIIEKNIIFFYPWKCSVLHSIWFCFHHCHSNSKQIKKSPTTQ